MPSTRSEASYSPSSSSKKVIGLIVAEANKLQKNKGQYMNSKLTNYAILKLIILFSLPTVLTPPQGASVDIYTASQKTYKNAFQHKEYQILEDLW
ncbi:hypothetical protein O181_101684 [Austropuccinia psidii MF-1]|uniref:Uncharacterized protein n=1 Tax=Austropuccinia psidii MF-1 TaxID=1389203 RepID=A0A9Q3JHP0_9BASI|nr:hypothetical protein [Austropuccinia psidii MF-1]